VVHLHHSPLPGREKWRKRLTDAPAVERILGEYGCELVVHGHGHRAHFHELSTAAGTAPVIAVPSASALGLHGADVTSYNCYQATPSEGGWQLEIQSRRYSLPSGDFSAADSRSLELTRLRRPVAG
jgi:3',5'-cyclic AMP phosphodiesterase CpdA